MNAKIKKTFVAGLAALTVAGALMASAAPAQAWGYRHHGFGWRGAGIVGGLALAGALAANAYSAPYYDCGRVRQPVVNRWGYVIGYRYVPAC
jgi:hypothetical protein